ncbi:hypothetical protein ACO0LG_28865, partial [Undibacterium sp. Ji42W]|uniref:hypothetical protein n=1 Tax=Undibacterium sp. Ji42W TaxID=3413039 RepID=UPI003BF32A3A
RQCPFRDFNYFHESKVNITIVCLQEISVKCEFVRKDVGNDQPLGSGYAWVAFFGIPFLATQERYVAVGLVPTGNR